MQKKLILALMAILFLGFAFMSVKAATTPTTESS